MFSGIWSENKVLVIKNSDLKNCLKSRQIKEGYENKGKFLDMVELSAELSTGVVDRKILVYSIVSVQPLRESG
jgi:hypothetical protein